MQNSTFPLFDMAKNENSSEPLHLYSNWFAPMMFNPEYANGTMIIIMAINVIVEYLLIL